MSRKLPELDENASFVGILLGIFCGAALALLRLKQRGAVTRKNLTGFGAGTAELEIEESLNEAKTLAGSRLESDA